MIASVAARCGPRLRRYARAFTFAGRDQIAYPFALLTRGLMLIVFVYVFNALWRAIAGGDGQLRGLTVVQLTWYLVFTEMVELARPSVMGEIQGQVQDGSIAYGLVRPYSYPLFALARAFGQAVTKTVPIGLAGAVVALALVGPLPGLAAALPRGLALLAGALLLNCLWMLVIGLTAFWFESVMPFQWIHQKLVFIPRRDALSPGPAAALAGLRRRAPAIRVSGLLAGAHDRRSRPGTVRRCAARHRAVRPGSGRAGDRPVPDRQAPGTGPWRVTRPACGSGAWRGRSA